MGLSHSAAIVATAIAKGESGWNTDAHNGTGRDDSYGLWQINRKAHGDRFGNGAQLKDIMANARAMASLSAGGTNWKPWTVYTSGKYRSHITAATKAAAEVVLPPNTAEGWEDVARNGAGIMQKGGIEKLPQLAGDLIGNPGDAIGAIGALTPLDEIAGAAVAILAALGDPAWWRRIGVGALGVLVLIGGALWLGRDLITDAVTTYTKAIP